MSDKPRRAWFQIHLSTAIVLMFVASGIVGVVVWPTRGNICIVSESRPEVGLFTFVPESSFVNYRKGGLLRFFNPESGKIRAMGSIQDISKSGYLVKQLSPPLTTEIITGERLVVREDENW